MWIIFCLSHMNQRWNPRAKTNHTRPSRNLSILYTTSSLLMLSKRGVALPHTTLCRLNCYIGYFIEDTQTSESVSTSRSAISKAALTWGGHHYFSSLSVVLYFLSGAPRLSLTELITVAKAGTKQGFHVLTWATQQQKGMDRPHL